MPLQVNNVSVQGDRLRITVEESLVGLGPLGSAHTPQEFQEVTRKLSGYPATAWAALSLPESLAGSVNVALLDIVGKFSRVPIYQVLGGPTRHKVRVMARISDLGQAKALWAQGHRAFAVDAGDPRTIAARLKEARQALPDADFVLDGAGKLTTGQAATIAAELETFHLLWFNEPCASYNLPAVKKIAAETVTPLGFGNVEYQEYLREDAIDVVRPSIMKLGIGGCRKVAALAEVYYVAAAPQRTASQLETFAALHVAASIPNFFIQEIPSDSPLLVRDGYVDLPTTPGLGVAA
jgi:galactonate dehydratase